MLKYRYPTLLLLLFKTLLAAQDPCGTDILHQEALNNPEYAAKHAAFEQKILQNAQSGAQEAPKMVITLPVVVHVIHNGGWENIPDAQIETGIQYLNDAFANAGYYDQGTGANTMIQFCLAQRTPDDQPTNGITRTQSILTELATPGAGGPNAMKDLSRWDPTRYINIWLVREVCPPPCAIAGFAYLPSAHGEPRDGIVMGAGYMGADEGFTVVLIHEMGHYLGLHHTFSGGCTNDDCMTDGDKVCDTPPDQTTGWLPCSTITNSCSTDTQSGFATDQNDMVTNFLDYFTFHCQHDFTQGQASRMHAAIQGARSSLLDSKGCQPVCPTPFSVMFNAPADPVYPDQPVAFTYTGTGATTFQWSVNGTPFSTDTNTSYTFASVGEYTVGLVATSDPADLCYDSFGLKIHVLCPTQASFNLSDTTIFLNQTLTLTNTSTGATSYLWSINSTPFSTDTNTSYTFSSVGEFTIGLVASGNPADVCYDSFEVKIHVLCPAQASFDLADTTIFLNQTLNLTNTSTGATTYLWSVNGTPFSTDANTAYTFSAAGEYTLSLVASGDVSGLCMDTFAVTVNVLCQLDAAFTASAAVLQPGETATFTNTSTGAEAYQWFVNDVPLTTTTDASFTPANEGFFTVTLVASNDPSTLCPPDTFTLQLEVRCTVTADFTPSDYTTEPGVTVTFTNYSLNYNTLEWFINGVSQGPSLGGYTFTNAGVYTVELVAGNGICEKSRLHYISVYDTCSASVFQKTFGNDLENTAVRAVYLDDGSLLIAGNTFLNNGLTDVVFLKLTPDGVPVWTKRWGNAATSEILGHLRALPGAQFAATATTTAFTSADPVFIKFDANGEPLWQRYVHTGFDDQFNGFNTTSDGGFIVAGAVRPTGGWEAYFLKLDANGNQQWAKMYNGGNTDFPNEVRELPGGGYICSGYTLSFGQNTNSIHDGMLMKLDAQGNLLWTKAYGQTGNEGFGRVFITADGGYITFGGSGSFNGNTDDVYFDQTWVVKTDVDGNLQWSKTYNTNLNIDCTARGTIPGNDGGYVLAANDFGALGNFETFFFKINDIGNIEWSRIYGASGIDRVVDVAATPNGYLLPGSSNSVGAGGSDMYIVKTDHAGYAGECLELEHLVAVNPVLPIVETGSMNSIATLALQTANIPVTDETSFTEGVLCATICGPELCDNGLDDDGDGLFDCLDPDCDCSTCEPSNADIWYFGDHSGLDFSQDPPVTLTDGQAGSVEASAVASDPFGHLLFYTDGKRLYTRTHTVMPNGSDLFGDGSTSQCLIVPQPGNPARFYVFTPNCVECGTNAGLSYSLVDMTLYGGLGDVVAGQKNIVLMPLSDRNENITAVRHCNGADYWVMGHSGVSNAYYAWLIDENGLNPTPVVSYAGIPAQTVSGFGDNVGQMKFSPDGTRIARALAENDGVEWCDFDPETGMVSNPHLFQSAGATDFYGLEFSPDGRLLYATSTAPTARLLQFNLASGAVTVLHDNPFASPLGQLQLAPNGKIYLTNPDYFFPRPFLSVVHQPNVAGPGCQFTYEEVSLAGTAGTHFGLPNFVCNTFWKPFVAFRPTTTADTVCTFPQTRTFFLEKLSCAVDSVAWQVEGNAGINSMGRDSITLTCSTAGEFTLTVRALAACGEATDTLRFTFAEPPLPVLELGPDTALCDNGIVTLNAGSGWTAYLWSDLSADSVTTAWFPGNWKVDVWDICGNKHTDSVQISILPDTELDLIDSLNWCQGNAASFTLPAPFTAWQWFPESSVDCTDCPTVNITDFNDTVPYIAVARTAEGCYSSDTLWLYPGDGAIQINVDTSLCDGDALTLFGASITTDTSLQITINSAIACDTLVNIQSVVWPVYGSSLDLAACPGETLTFNGQTLTTDTSYLFVFSTLHGCDSTWVVTVETLDTSLSFLTLEVCPGASVTFDNQTLVPGGPYVFPYTAQNGCDSTWIVTVETLDTILSFLTLAACPGASVTFDNQELVPGGPYVFPYTAQNGCDSTWIVTVETLDTTLSFLTLAACPGASVTFDNQTLVPGGPYVFPYTAQNGCDSTWIVTVETLDTSLNFLTLTACQGSTVEFDDQLLIPGGPYVFPYTALNGCDSTWVVQVNAADSILQNVQITVCDNETADWQGQILLPDSTYTFVLTAQNGCDSTILVQVTGQSAPSVVLPSDTLLQLGQSIDLTPVVSGAGPFAFVWQPAGLLSCSACPDPVAIPLNDTWFSVTVTDGAGCRATDSVQVRVNPDCGIYMPNVFRPDGDGYNDSFHPFTGNCIREVLILRVYDRWGELVFERKNFPPNTENMGWDGAFRGEPANPGVYAWVAEFEFIDGKKNTQKGDVTLIR